MRKVSFHQTGHSGNSTLQLERVVSLSHELNCLTKLEVFSYSAIAGVTLQLPLHASHVCHSGDLLVTSQSRDSLELHIS